jgi:hypothetical protein
MGLLSSLFGFGKDKSNKTESTEPPIESMSIPVTNITATPQQRERRARSEEICTSRNIPIYKNPNSLFVDSDEMVSIRTQDEVVDRALALMYIGLKSEGLEQVHLDRVDAEFNIMSKLSPIEKAYATATNPTQQQAINANWRYEGLHVMLWALGYIDQLVYPDQMCNVGDDVGIIYKLKNEGFRNNARLRNKQEILDEADLILRYNWACVSARIKGEEAPSELNGSIVVERHHALNWLICQDNEEWDDVMTNT